MTPDEEIQKAQALLKKAKNLWHGFQPTTIPVAIYVPTKEKTLLFGHPKPPAPFQEKRPHEYEMTGRWEGLTANTNGVIAGIPTALLSVPPNANAQDLAGLIAHETFHVYQRKQYPKWGGNEVDLFVYPFEEVRLLTLRIEETLLLRKALNSRTKGGAIALSQAFARTRQARYEKMALPFRLYEQATEQNEGLAQYVEAKINGKQPQLPRDDYPADSVRQRCYATGHAIALLLDRLSPDWQTRLHQNPEQPLDVLLSKATVQSQVLSSPPNTSDLSKRAARIAQTRLSQYKKAISDLRQQVLSKPGWHLEISSTSPLFPAGFDPLNVRRLSEKEILHTRFVKVANDNIQCEILNAWTLTTGQGKHPLFEGIIKVDVLGILEKPRIEDSNIYAKDITIIAPSAQIEVDESRKIIRLRQR
jgi:hypothetical protein